MPVTSINKNFSAWDIPTGIKMPGKMLRTKTKDWKYPVTVRKDCYETFNKVIVSGDVLEFYQYSRPIIIGAEIVGQKPGKGIKGDKSSDNINKTKLSLRRLINTNVGDDNLFITLTFAENIQDIDYAKDYFKKFIKKVNYNRKKEGSENLKYIYVIEFQKRGSIHFHCIFFDIAFLPHAELWKMWSKDGMSDNEDFVWLKDIKENDNIGSYVVKYMDKSLDDDRLKGYDLYGRSRGNLKKPLEFKNPVECEQLAKAYGNKIVCYENTLYNDYRGLIDYKQINLKRQNDLIE